MVEMLACCFLLTEQRSKTVTFCNSGYATPLALTATMKVAYVENGDTGAWLYGCIQLTMVTSVLSLEKLIRPFLSFFALPSLNKVTSRMNTPEEDSRTVQDTSLSLSNHTPHHMTHQSKECSRLGETLSPGPSDSPSDCSKGMSNAAAYETTSPSFRWHAGRRRHKGMVHRWEKKQTLPLQLQT